MATPGEQALERVREAAREVLTAAAFDLAGRAAADAPIESGRLRASASPGPGGLAEIDEVGDRMTIKVTFSTPYAAAQHEGHAIMHRGTATYEWRARNWPGGGGPKFLENNLKAMAPRYVAALAAAVRVKLAAQ